MDFLSRHLGTFSKNFVCNISDAKLGRRKKQMFVTIRHNHISGSRQVLVNGVPIPFTRGTTGIWQSQDEIVFKTEDGLHTIRVMILNDVINNLREKFLYAVTIDGEECKPCDVLRDKLIDDLNSSNPDQQSMVAGQPAYDPSLAYTIRISIDSHKVSTENFEKKPVALFRVTTTRTNTEDPDVDNEVSVSWYRFSEMLELNGVLKTSYKQSHLQSSFPEFPPRCYDPRVLQFEEPFLLERRELLQNWVRRVCGLPRIGMNQDFLRFAQLKPIQVAIVD